MAAGLFRKWMGADGEWQAESAGLSAPAGVRPTREALAVMQAQGVDIGGHRSRKVNGELVDRAKLIVVMTKAHRDAILKAYPAARD